MIGREDLSAVLLLQICSENVCVGKNILWAKKMRFIGWIQLCMGSTRGDFSSLPVCVTPVHEIEHVRDRIIKAAIEENV